jgi:hypothetical protein
VPTVPPSPSLPSPTVSPTVPSSLTRLDPKLSPQLHPTEHVAGCGGLCGSDGRGSGRRMCRLARISPTRARAGCRGTIGWAGWQLGFGLRLGTGHAVDEEAHLNVLQGYCITLEREDCVIQPVKPTSTNV